MEVPVILDFFIGNVVPGSRVKALASADSSSALPHSFLGSACALFSSVQFLGPYLVVYAFSSLI